MIRDFVKRLGSLIRSCHAKDVVLHEKASVHLDEVRPGLGGLDYRAYLGAVASLDPDLSVMIEHLPNESEYDLAAANLRSVAGELGLAM
jgi:sugar phosphate isomerase/epimerase